MHEGMKRKEQHGDDTAFEQVFLTNNTREGRTVKKSGACRHCGKHGALVAQSSVRAQKDRQRSVQANLARNSNHATQDMEDYLFMAQVGGFD